jgi:hypothetical protein
VFLLATGDAKRLFSEFNSLLTDIQDKPLQMAGLSCSDIGDLVRFRMLSVLFHAAAFYRRVVVSFECYPFLLFWFVKVAMDQVCTTRQRIAAAMVEALSEGYTLHPTAMKLLHLCPNDIRNTALTGLCGVKLYVIVWSRVEPATPTARKPHQT